MNMENSKNRKQIRAVIFDMDGLLIDSERFVLQAWKEVAESHGYMDILIPYMNCIGTNKLYSEQIMKQYYGENFPFKELDREKTEYYIAHFGQSVPLKTGAAEILAFLKENGVKLALASSTREEVCRRALENNGILSFFDVLCCGDKIRKSKPAPDIYLEAASRLNTAPAFCAGIEDSFNGVRAVHAAGMLAVMVPDMKQPDEEIRSLADVVCTDLFGVRDFLRRMLKPAGDIG